MITHNQKLFSKARSVCTHHISLSPTTYASAKIVFTRRILAWSSSRSFAYLNASTLFAFFLMVMRKGIVRKSKPSSRSEIMGAGTLGLPGKDVLLVNLKRESLFIGGWCLGERSSNSSINLTFSFCKYFFRSWKADWVQFVRRMLCRLILSITFDYEFSRSTTTSEAFYWELLQTCFSFQF